MVDDLIPLDFFVSENGSPSGASAMRVYDLMNMIYYYERTKLNKTINTCVEKATQEGLLVKSECGNYSIFNWPKET